jgi:uncharacterized membrane protein
VKMEKTEKEMFNFEEEDLERNELLDPASYQSLYSARLSTISRISGTSFLASNKWNCVILFRIVMMMFLIGAIFGSIISQLLFCASDIH